MKLIIVLLLLNIYNLQQPYIGGNDPNFIYNNPSLINNFLKNTKGKLSEACKVIPGIGQAVLSVRQVQQAIEGLMDNSNQESNAKIIFFKEFANPKTKQLLYKAVIMIKTFTSTLYVAIESIYKPQGYPSFEVISYLMDTDLDNIKMVLKDESIDPHDIFACGDIKEIFTRKMSIPVVVEEEHVAQHHHHAHSHNQQQNRNQQIFYGGHPLDIKPDPLQPYNVASTRTRANNIADPKYNGIDN